MMHVNIRGLGAAATMPVTAVTLSRSGLAGRVSMSPLLDVIVDES